MAQTVGGFQVYRDSAGHLYDVPATVGGVASVMTGTELDTAGNPVPVFKAHSYTYDGSGNLATDTVTDGANVWVRTYAWSNGAQASDSGWVKQ